MHINFQLDLFSMAGNHYSHFKSLISTKLWILYICQGCREIKLWRKVWPKFALSWTLKINDFVFLKLSLFMISLNVWSQQIMALGATH